MGLETYDFTDQGHSVVAANNFNAHLGWQSGCHGGGDGHGSNEEALHHDGGVGIGEVGRWRRNVDVLIASVDVGIDVG